MIEKIAMDGLEAFQLKECYELALQYEKLDLAKDVLRKKTKRIDVSMNYSPVQTDVSYQESEMQVLSEALYNLSLEGFNASDDSGFQYAYKIDNLPASAEKEFILALISLRRGTNETQRLDALRHISVALSYSPNDPRFIVLADILQQAGNKRG